MEAKGIGIQVAIESPGLRATATLRSGRQVEETRPVSQSEQLIRNVSDTALWAAVYRAAETDRPDALFRDPFARRLAGERGQQIAESVPAPVRADWPWVGRTYLFDQFIVEQLRQGVDMVVNLAAGLDARPYRMELPSSLQWVEVDLPGILDYKEAALAGEQPRGALGALPATLDYKKAAPAAGQPGCALERVRLDLSDAAARRELVARLGHQARKALILTEGLLIYLSADEVARLARELAGPH